MSVDAGLTLVLLLGGHALADYPLQGQFMSDAKNRNVPIPGVPWWQVLTAHAVIHGSFVALITGVWWLAIPETVTHWVTDDAKCARRISYNIDQAIHVVCKLVWWVIAVKVM